MNIGNDPSSQQCTYLEVQTNLVPASYEFVELIQMNCSLTSYNFVVKWHKRIIN